MRLDAFEVAADDDGLQSRLERAKLPISDLTEPDQFFYTFANAAGTVGCGGFFLDGSDALLRSIAVDAGARGQGAGVAIVETLSGIAKQKGAQAAWLLTTDAESFFARVGFNKVARADAPPSIVATPQFSGICPGSAALMRRLLREESHVPL